MSYQAVSAVLAHSRATGSDRLVLLVLASHASKETFECYTGRDLLCKEAAMSERNLIYCLKRLEEAEELTINRGNGRGNLTSYTINLEPVEESERVQSAAPFIAQERVQNPAERVQEPAPLKTERVQPVVERVQNPVIKGAKVVSAYKDIEPSGTIKKPKEDIYLVQVPEVFAYWQAALNHPQAKLTTKRKKNIQARLKDGYTVVDIKRAIDGCRASPFHMGQNESGAIYDDIELICRNGEKLENFISRSNGNGKPAGTYRETPNERNAREYEELVRRSLAASNSGISPDSADADAPGIAVDFRRL